MIYRDFASQKHAQLRLFGQGLTQDDSDNDHHGYPSGCYEGIIRESMGFCHRTAERKSLALSPIRQGWGLG